MKKPLACTEMTAVQWFGARWGYRGVVLVIEFAAILDPGSIGF
jgi:hypothetical protein